jgi:uncharacterized protein (DUF2267 family)
MDYDEIIEAIRQAGGGLSRDTAERAAQATLQTVAERSPEERPGTSSSGCLPSSSRSSTPRRTLRRWTSTSS